MTLQVRLYDSHGWAPWKDVELPYHVGFQFEGWSDFELREKPSFVPGWFQDYSMEEYWMDHKEQGRIKWFDSDLTGSSKWRRVEVTNVNLDEE